MRRALFVLTVCHRVITAAGNGSVLMFDAR